MNFNYRRLSRRLVKWTERSSQLSHLENWLVYKENGEKKETYPIIQTIFLSYLSVSDHSVMNLIIYFLMSMSYTVTASKGKNQLIYFTKLEFVWWYKFIPYINIWGAVYIYLNKCRSPLAGASNSDTTPMSQRFYRPVYF